MYHCDSYFDRVESLLRRSLGVSLSARGKANVRPAPPVDTTPLPETSDDEEAPASEAFQVQDFEDWQKVKARLQSGESQQDQPKGHDEL